MTTCAFIHARGGSKRCPRKNIRSIVGKPLIAHTILQAKNHKLIDHVIVSTDDEEIASIAKIYGARVLRRPAELCVDEAPEFASWQYAIDQSKPMDIFVNLPCTAPLRSAEDITKTIETVRTAEIAFTVKHVPHLLNSYTPLDYAVVGSCYATTPDYIRGNMDIWGGYRGLVIVPPERALDIDTEYDFRVAKLLMENS